MKVASPPHGSTNGDQYSGAPVPDALLPTLDDDQLATLRQVGQEWDRVLADPDAWRRVLPIDPNLVGYPDSADIRPSRFGRFVPVAGRDALVSAVEATSEAEAPPSAAGRAAYKLRRALLGPPLSASAIAHERMRKLVDERAALG
jgi:hypothetical protein